MALIRQLNRILKSFEYSRGFCFRLFFYPRKKRLNEFSGFQEFVRQNISRIFPEYLLYTVCIILLLTHPRLHQLLENAVIKDIINKKISVETEIDHYISYEKVNRIKEEVPEIKVLKENTRVLLYFSTSATLKWSRQDWQKEFNWIAKKASDLSEVIEKID